MRIVSIVTMFMFSFVACDEAQQLLNDFNRLEGQYDLESYREIPGSSVSDHLSKRMGAKEENVTSILSALNIAETEEANANLVKLGLITQEESEAPQAVTTEVATVLNKNQGRKLNMDANAFLEDDNSFFEIASAGLVAQTKLANDSVTWSASEEEFVVSVAAKIPVRDQGRRGTCSSFAGIGQIEGALLKKYSTLESIDLSEQRFYYMSKPENWETGGDPNQGGSNAGSGFSKSNGYSWPGESHTYPPGSPDDFNIPLEANCPYNKYLGSNDLQTPQAAGCEDGVAKVQDFAAWVYEWDKRPKTAQEIYDWLLTEDYPLVTASKLSQNWEYNDGMITLAGAGGTPGDSTHASGHAYLIVGAKKLNESEFPGEGGMCFIIKNSWGTGWGVNGYACMTLAWFNAWRYEDGFPAAFDVELDPDKYEEVQAYLDSRPDELINPDDGTRTDNGGRQSQGKSRTGTASFFAQSSTVKSLHLTLSEDMEYGSLLAENDEFYKVLYKIENDNILIRGIKADDKTVTHGIDLSVVDQKLVYKEDNYDDLEVGSIDTEKKLITLCSDDYLNRCHVNYIEESNELTIGLSQEEALKQKSEGPYNWSDISLAGYGAGISAPSGLSNKIDMRFKVDGKDTNPLRFLVKPLSGDVMYNNKTVGNYQNFSFCNDTFKDVCRVVVSGDDFNVNFKANDPNAAE